MVANAFDRITSTGHVNAEARTTDATGDAYKLELQLSPTSIPPNGAATARLIATYGGQPIPDQIITVTSTSPGVSIAPTTIRTTSDGQALFALIGGTVGSTTISASMSVSTGGAVVVIPSNSIVLTVTATQQPVLFTFQGYGQVELTLEGPLANALFPKPQRLSHAEQTRKFPGDMGLIFAAEQENADETFLPAWMQK